MKVVKVKTDGFTADFLEIQELPAPLVLGFMSAREPVVIMRYASELLFTACLDRTKAAEMRNLSINQLSDVIQAYASTESEEISWDIFEEQ